VLEVVAPGSFCDVEARAKQDGVTIFIPNWNHRSFLAASVASALEAARAIRGTGSPAEVIVVDDASRDGSQKLLRSIAAHVCDEAFGTLLLGENHGIAAVRNMGLRLARYRAVLFLDADNQIVPEALPVLHRALSATGAALVYGNLVDIEGGAAAGLRSNEVATLGLTVENYIDALALVDAAQALEVGGYLSDGTLDYWEDWEFVLHLIAEERSLVFVPVVAGRYRLVPLSRDAAPRRTDLMARMRRVFSQTGTQQWDPRRVGRIYHPAVGYLDEAW
jgi:glycosyltransferase involved in cell wall biosynthesis